MQTFTVANVTAIILLWKPIFSIYLLTVIKRKTTVGRRQKWKLEYVGRGT